MANLVINKDLAKRLQTIAQRENRPVDSLIEELVDDYENGFDEDALLEAVPPDIEDKAAGIAALKELRPKLYKKAREYWKRVGDKERLALSNRELDRQFWLIDHEGIPRLKSDQGKVQLPPDPLEAFVGLFVDSDLTDMSTTVRETIAEHYRKKNASSD
jgi:hypothetical protein